jgi:transposase
MGRPGSVSPEVRERAVWMVREQAAATTVAMAAIDSIADKLGCTTETLRRSVRQAERDGGERPGLTDGRATAAEAAGTREVRVEVGRRDSAQGVSISCTGGPRPANQPSASSSSSQSRGGRDNPP